MEDSSALSELSESNLASPPTQPRSRPAQNFAFLVHSQESVTNRRPPTVDNKHLARQRRRRTSPEDQAILEHEFARDSKPDKASRARIAARVALGEKEIQIWFQNRRSTARRRSGPWIPPDYLPRSSDPVQDDGTSTQIEGQNDPSAQDDPFTREWSAFIGGAAEPSHHDGIPQHEATKADEIDTQGEGQQYTTYSLTRSTSGVRLSMTSNGGARVLCCDEETPSPPRLNQSSDSSVTAPSSPSSSLLSLSPSASSSKRGLRRRYSATGFTDSFACSQGSTSSQRNGQQCGSRRSRLDQPRPQTTTTTIPRTRHIPNGRSRDSRAWQYWCDAGSRDGILSQQAKQEQKGSAADAISLIRATRMMKSHKANIPTFGRAKSFSSLPDKLGSKPRSRISRSKTSEAPASSRPIIIYEDGNAPQEMTANPKASGNPDSDKENRDPRQFFSTAKKELQQNDGLRDPEDDEDISNFMRGKNGKQERRAGDDLDCIRGLLSLSRG